MGLGVKLVKGTLPLVGTEFVEMPAVMAKYNSFAEKAGIKKIVEQTPPREAMKIDDMLQELGFNTSLLGSNNYSLAKLRSLNEAEVIKIRNAFIRNSHVRFMKYFFSHAVYGKKQAYSKEINEASLDKLARLIKVCSFLMQKKIYLFWSLIPNRLLSIDSSQLNKEDIQYCI